MVVVGCSFTELQHWSGLALYLFSLIPPALFLSSTWHLVLGSRWNIWPESRLSFHSQLGHLFLDFSYLKFSCPSLKSLSSMQCCNPSHKPTIPSEQLWRTLLRPLVLSGWPSPIDCASVYLSFRPGPSDSIFAQAQEFSLIVS